MPEQETQEQSQARFKNVDIKFCKCFGGYHDSNNWLVLAQKSITDGWKNIDSYHLEKSLANDVDQSYFNLTTVEVVDVATDVAWTLSFVNDKGLWKLQIKNSPDAEVLDEDKSAFFASDAFSKITKECFDILQKALETFNQVVKHHLEQAELLDVDEVKLSAILYWLNDKMLMENYRIGKYIY